MYKKIINYHRAHMEHKAVFMNYLANLDVTEEIDGGPYLIRATINVPRALGPGLLESACEAFPLLSG